MEIVAPPPPLRARAATLLAAAYTPNEQLVRSVEHAYRASACGGWALVDPCGLQSIDHGINGVPVGEVISAFPFDVETVETCSAFGLDDQGLQDRARARLASILSAAVARELWTGELAAAAGWANNPRLAGATDLNAAGAVAPAVGLAMIEDALAGMLDGVPGTVHCTPGAATILNAGGALRREGDLLLTCVDTRVIADAGYPGTSPAGAAAAAATYWLYGSAQPTVRTGPAYVEPLTVAQALDRSVNTLHYTAHQLGWVAFPCDVVAVRITAP